MSIGQAIAFLTPTDPNTKLRKPEDIRFVIGLFDKVVSMKGWKITGEELFDKLRSISHNRNTTAHVAATNDEFTKWTTTPTWIALWQKKAAADLVNIKRIERL